MLMKISTAHYIHSVEDLLENEHVHFGTIGSGSTFTFFRVNTAAVSGLLKKMLSIKYGKIWACRKHVLKNVFLKIPIE